MSECRFELNELRCVECGKYTGETGTCADIAYCPECRAQFERLIGKEKFAAHVIQLIEGTPYHPKGRVLHFDSGSGTPVCNVKGGPHPLTNNLNEANCKKCIRKSVTVAA